MKLWGRVSVIASLAMVAGCQGGWGYAKGCAGEGKPICNVLDPDDVDNQTELQSKDCKALCKKISECEDEGGSGWVWVDLDRGDDGNLPMQCRADRLSTPPDP